MLQHKQITKLSKEILLFSSSFEGEQLSALNAANKTLAKNNSSWHEIVEALNGGDSDVFNRGAEAGYSAGYAEGYRRGSQTIPPNNLDHHQMLSELKQKEHVLNQWSKSFIDNLHNKGWNLTHKQKRCIEKLYRQFCGK